FDYIKTFCRISAQHATESSEWPLNGQQNLAIKQKQATGHTTPPIFVKQLNLPCVTMYIAVLNKTSVRVKHGS
ncbi:MAG: hypothetical protein LBF17_02080, partial [Mediterranea sp.]|nr:hypothetical protein [Mediterranea sp.]